MTTRESKPSLGRLLCRNERGSVLLMSLIMAGIFLIVAASLIGRFGTIAKEHRQFAIANENMRVADELANIVARAYEYGKQTSPCPYAGQMLAVNGTALCFAAYPDTTNWGRCVVSAFNSNNHVCLDVTQSTLIAREDGQEFIHFGTKVVTTPSKKSFDLLSSLIPNAFADVAQTAMPPNPTGFANLGPAYTCGTGVDPAICHYCGNGQSNICFEISFCSAETIGCTAASEIKIDMMIAR